MTDVLAAFDDVLDAGGATVRFVRAPWALPPSRVVRLAHLDPEALADLRLLHARLARDLAFPDYYGENWDALADVLTDDDVFGDVIAFVVVVADGARALAAAPGHLDRLAEVVQEADRAWRDAPTRRFVRLVIVSEEGPRPAPARQSRACTKRG